jgi:general secretion pathway protein D
MQLRKILILLTILTVPMSNSFSQEQSITPNYVGVELRSVIEAVSSITGKNFIIDPRVRAEVTLLSATPMTTDAFYFFPCFKCMVLLLFKLVK